MDRGQETAAAQLGDPQVDAAHLGGAQARPVVVAVAKVLLAALVAIGAEDGGDLQLDQLLQTMAHQFRDQLPGTAAIQ